MDKPTGIAEDEFLNLLLECSDLAGFLQGLAQACARELSGPSDAHCSVRVERERRKAVVGNSSDTAARMDEVTYSCGEGPGQDALVTGQIVYVADLLNDTRYPRYRKAMAGVPVRSVIGVPIPLPASSEALAVLNCYAEGSPGFPDERRAKAQELARLASRPLLLALRVADTSGKTADLASSLSRSLRLAWPRR
ncbi:GAF domain-containing protein [Sinomonas mesophila]|uniref:GAF domain-containing protein n=1 Tax=Sinomonas mesophila TaxID=1531955 RepID=UPI00158AC08D|nr:GAF domain-containing protein [Sinomonas mesophila]